MTMSEKDIIELAAQKAAQVTLETLAKQKKKERREGRDWRLRNTRLHLEHLQEFDTHAHKSVYDVRKVLESAQNDPEGVYSQQLSGRQDVYLEGLAISAGRTETFVRQTKVDAASSTVCSVKREMRKSSGGIVSWRPTHLRERIINRLWMRKRSPKALFSGIS